MWRGGIEPPSVSPWDNESFVSSAALEWNVPARLHANAKTFQTLFEICLNICFTFVDDTLGTVNTRTGRTNPNEAAV